jgi:uncharacterized protein (TIGR00369 family)
MMDEVTPIDLRVPLSQLGSGTSAAAFMQDASDRIPLHTFLGLEVQEVDEGRAVATFRLTEQLQGQVEPLHGAAVFALAAFASGAATWGSWDPATSMVIVQETHLRLLGQPRSSPISAEGQLVHRGKRTLSTDCTVTDGGGYVTARSSTTFLIIGDYGGNPT